SVWQVWLALRLMTGAESTVRDRRNRTQELRLLPGVQLLLEIVGHRDQLGFAHSRAVHQHAGRSAGGTNSHRHRKVRVTGHRWTGRIRQMRSDDGIKIQRCYLAVDSGLGRTPSVISRRDVTRIVRITRKLIREQEYILVVVRHLLRAMRV